MINLPIYSQKKLLLSFEYGLIFSETAKSRGIELTPELVNKMEEIISGEFKKKSPTRLSVDMIPNILASFETK